MVIGILQFTRTIWHIPGMYAHTRICMFKFCKIYLCFSDQCEQICFQLILASIYRSSTVLSCRRWRTCMWTLWTQIKLHRKHSTWRHCSLATDWYRSRSDFRAVGKSHSVKHECICHIDVLISWNRLFLQIYYDVEIVCQGQTLRCACVKEEKVTLSVVQPFKSHVTITSQQVILAVVLYR